MYGSDDTPLGTKVLGTIILILIYSVAIWLLVGVVEYTFHPRF